MIDELKNKCVNILAAFIFAFRFCSFLNLLLDSVEFNKLVNSRSLTPKGDSPEDKLPSWAWASPNQTLDVVSSHTRLGWCWIVHREVTEFCSRCRQESRGESIPQHSSTFVNPVAYFQRAGFQHHISKDACVIRVHRYRWIQLACTVGCTSHTLIYSHQSARDSRGSTCGMTAMPKHWSDPGHSPFLKGNVINYNSVYFMRLGEVHHHESQHGERINSVFAGVLCSSCIPRVHFSLSAWKIFLWA